MHGNVKVRPRLNVMIAFKYVEFRLGENLVSTGKLFQSVIAEFTKERLITSVLHLLDSSLS